MNWLVNLFNGEGIAHSVFILALVISIGVMLSKIKIKGVSLGITWILFAGIFFGHFNMTLDHQTLHFIKEFGLILFIFSIGMQVGSGFFSSFKKGGFKLNTLAALIVGLGVLITYIIYKTTSLPITTMVGILSGAVTNTPGLGAAQQTCEEMTGTSAPDIAMGYAVAYPLAVVGIILTMIFFKYIFRIDIKNEESKLLDDSDSADDEVMLFSLSVDNPSLFGKTIGAVKHFLDREFVISRIKHENGDIVAVSSKTVLKRGDVVMLVTAQKEIDSISAFIGKCIDMKKEEWRTSSALISRRIVLTNPKHNGKKLGSLRLRSLFEINLTRVNRAGVDLIASPSLVLQLGDRITVVGTENAILSTEKILGNSLKRLREPNLITIFLGIALGVLLGSIPFMFPGIPQPVKLGLAGGPLIVSILLSRFGHKYKLITYTTMSANLMLREIGISLFLACVGLGAGEGFVNTLVNGGYIWVGYGVIITLVPLLVVGFIARYAMKINYFTIIGLLGGAMTDPPALAYANSSSDNDAPSVSYATVYPLTMFLRVISAQLLILFLL